jgi:hypothetical protein
MSTAARNLEALPGDEDRPLRFVTAASLFDGHDAAINIIRRILQSQGAEVVHLGHNRSVADIVRAALCRKTPTASPCPPTRAGTTSISATWWTCCASTAPSTSAWSWAAAGRSRPRSAARWKSTAWSVYTARRKGSGSGSRA